MIQIVKYQKNDHNEIMDSMNYIIHMVTNQLNNELVNNKFQEVDYILKVTGDDDCCL